MLSTPIQACAVLIVGAGPAGLSAALAAAPSGRGIVVLDDNPAPGGQVWRQALGTGLPQPSQSLQERLAQFPNVRILCGTRVVASHGPLGLLLEGPHKAWVQGFERLILCNGARELMLPFPGWTLPGVTGAGGLQALIKGGLPVKGQRIVVAGTGPLLLAAAASAQQAGAVVVRVLEQSPWPTVMGFGSHLLRWPGKLVQATQLMASLASVYRCNSYVAAASGTDQVQQLTVQQGDQMQTLNCDRLAVGYGLVPNVELGRMLGCTTQSTPQGDLALQVDANQTTKHPHIFAAGECTGIGGAEKAMAEGTIAGYAAIGQQAPPSVWRARTRWQSFAKQIDTHFGLRPEVLRLARPDTLLCRCEDVPMGAVSNCTDWHDAKLHHRCGMGVCQGRICGAAALHVLGWQAPAPRPPLSPTRVSTLMLAVHPQDDAL